MQFLNIKTQIHIQFLLITKSIPGYMILKFYSKRLMQQYTTLWLHVTNGVLLTS